MDELRQKLQALKRQESKQQTQALDKVQRSLLTWCPPPQQQQQPHTKKKKPVKTQWMPVFWPFFFFLLFVFLAVALFKE